MLQAAPENSGLFNIYKPLGWTPLQALEAFQAKLKADQSHFISKSMTYAGRLDPAAEGVLLLVSGEQIKNKERFLNLDKNYTAEILLGFKSDTYDALGLAQISNFTKLNSKNIKKVLDSYLQGKIFTIPPYSSVPVNGKPMFEWALQNKLDQIEIPKRVFKIKKADLENIKDIDPKSIEVQILKMLRSVTGDFRQEQIKNNWLEILNKIKQPLQVAVVKIECESGTYVRSVADQLGKDLGTNAILLNLVRTRIGNYRIEDSISVLPRQYVDSSPNL